jgi:hypothetical protein
MMRRSHTGTVRTTITLRDEALKLSKQKAQELGKSLGDVISDAILAAFGQRASRGAAKRPRLPVSGKGGLQPGVDLDDSSALADRMDGRGE